MTEAKDLADVKSQIAAHRESFRNEKREVVSQVEGSFTPEYYSIPAVQLKGKPTDLKGVPTVKLTKNQREVLEFISGNTYANYREISDDTGLKEGVVENILEQLREKGLLDEDENFETDLAQFILGKWF